MNQPMCHFLFLFFTVLFWSSCESEQTSDNAENGSKLVAQEDYKKNKQHRAQFAQSSPSEFFTINPKKDTILLSQTGTLFFLPKNNFIDEQGNPVTEQVQVEWQEMSTLKEAFDNNLTTVDDKGQFLQTGGMFWLGATTNKGEPVKVNQSIRIEKNSVLSIAELKQYKALWKGEELVWGAPQERPKNMTLIDLEVIEESIQAIDNSYIGWKEMPLQRKPQKVLTQDYSLQFGYGCKTLEVLQLLQEDAAYRKAIAQTWIATNEFKKRLWALIQACSLKGFKLYLEHTDKNLWEADELVVALLEKENNPATATFRKFAALKNTVVRGTAPLPKSLLQKLAAAESKVEQIKEEVHFFSYPIVMSCEPNNYINLDKVLDFEYQKEETKEYLEQISWNITLENCPPNKQFQVFAVLKGAYSLVRLTPIGHKKEFRLQAKMDIPKGQELLFLVKGDKNEYIGYAEKVQLKQNLQVKLQPKPIAEQPNYQQLLQQYMQPSQKLCFSTNKKANCCSNEM